MALSGSWTHVWEEEDSVLTDEVLVAYPSDLPEDDINYSKRGTSVSESVPHINILSQSYDNVYIRMTGLSIYTPGAEVGDNTTPKELNYVYQVLPDAASKSVSGSVFVHEDVLGIEYDGQNTDNPFTVAYSHLKATEGFENLIDV